MNRLLLATAALVALSLPATAATMTHDTIGCANYEEYEALIHFIVEKDKQAYIKYATTHDCNLFKEKETVIVSKPGIMSSCIRTRGYPVCFWVSNAAFNRAGE